MIFFLTESFRDFQWVACSTITSSLVLDSEFFLNVSNACKGIYQSTDFLQDGKPDECSVSNYDSVEIYWECYLFIFFSSKSLFIIFTLLSGKLGIEIHSAVPWRELGTLLISRGGVSDQ